MLGQTYPVREVSYEQAAFVQFSNLPRELKTPKYLKIARFLDGRQNGKRRVYMH